MPSVDKSPFNHYQKRNVSKGFTGRERIKHFPFQSTLQRTLKAAINSPHFNRLERKITINVETKLSNSCSCPAPALKLSLEKGRVAFSLRGEAVILHSFGFYQDFICEIP